ncbi:hypothetical protein MNBD_NITROSPINAE03-1780 [hydrothermal vent metagenome]|uniref:SpoVT-AbrB domain-containing protein n=1 Tax=hydrothermal vent metagenome TaxID=652676 RepID=A0A3B1BZ45_9ZZZZ
MKVAITRIGNSRGIRIPKPILEQAHITDEVDLTVEHDRIVLRSVMSLRHGWSEQFQKMNERGDDLLLEPDSCPSEWEKEEWEW